MTYPDQPVWSNTVVTQLVAGKSLSSLLQPFGDALGAGGRRRRGMTVAKN